MNHQELMELSSVNTGELGRKQEVWSAPTTSDIAGWSNASDLRWMGIVDSQPRMTANDEHWD